MHRDDRREVPRHQNATRGQDQNQVSSRAVFRLCGGICYLTPERSTDNVGRYSPKSWCQVARSTEDSPPLSRVNCYPTGDPSSLNQYIRACENRPNRRSTALASFANSCLDLLPDDFTGFRSKRISNLLASNFFLSRLTTGWTGGRRAHPQAYILCRIPGKIYCC